MWWKAIDPAHERRRLGNGWRGQPGTWVQPSEERYPVPNYPGITRTENACTHYVKLLSMQEEKRFRSWNSALRFFEDNATPADRARCESKELSRCAREERAMRRGSHSQVAPARVFRAKPGTRSQPSPPAEEPPPPVEEPPPPEDDDADLGNSLETLLGEMGTNSIDTDVPFEPFDIPEGPVFTAEELETLHDNECSNLAGYRGVKWYRTDDQATYPFYSTVRHEGVRYTLGSHRTAEEAALHAANARKGLQHSSYRLSERWSKEETQRLMAAVQKEGCAGLTPGKGVHKWAAVAAHVRTRTVRQCHRRWEVVDPNPDERQLASRKRRHERDAANKRARREAKHEAELGITEGWLAATTERVGDAPFENLNEIDGALLRADEALDPSDDFVDARRQRVAPARVFVFTQRNTNAFHYHFGSRKGSPPPSPPPPPPPPPVESSATPPPEEVPPVAQSSTLPGPKITDYLLARKNRRPEAPIVKEASPQSNAESLVIKGVSKSNAMRVLDLAAAL